MSACECTTMRAADPGRQAEDRAAFARAQLGSSAGGHEPSAGSTTKKSRGWTSSLWTPVGARNRSPSSVGPQIPPPVPATQLRS